MSQLDTHNVVSEVEPVSGSPSRGGRFSPGPPNWMPTGFTWLRCARQRHGCRGVFWVAPWVRLAGWETYVCSTACAQRVSGRATVSFPDPRGPVVPPRRR